MGQVNDKQQFHNATQTDVPHKRIRKAFFIVPLLFLVIAIVAILFFRSSSNPIAGYWPAFVTVQDDDVLPVVTDTYIEINLSLIHI